MSGAEVNVKGVLADFLQSTDTRCPSCAYSLRGCTSDRCPECGAALSLRLAAQRNGVGWWLAGVLGSAVSLGMTVVFLFPSMQMVSAMFANPYLQSQVRAGVSPMSILPHWKGIWPLALLTAATCLFFGWMISQRGAFARRGAWMNAIIGMLGACSPLILLLIVNRVLAWM